MSTPLIRLRHLMAGTQGALGNLELYNRVVAGSVNHAHNWGRMFSLEEADPRRQGGNHANAAMWLDPYLKNTCIMDPLGGSVAFYDARVRLEQVV